MSDYWCALVIDGVGDDEGIYAFCLGNPDLAPAGYQGVDIMTEHPQNLSGSLDPIKIEQQLSGFTFSLQAMQPYLALFMRRLYQADGALITEVDADDTTLEIAYSGALSAGDFVWVGKECIKLGTLSSSNTYTDPATDQEVSYDVFTGCERGALGSEAEAHYVTSEDDNRVYSYPELSGRLCEFWEQSEGDDAPARVWQGIINDVRLDDEDESTVLVDTTDSLSILVGRTLNRQPYAAEATTEVVARSVGVDPGVLYLFGPSMDAPTAAHAARYGKTGFGGTNRRHAFQVGSALVPGLVSTATSTFRDLVSLGQLSYEQLDSKIDAEEDGAWSRLSVGSRINEVLCFGTDFYDQYGNYYGCGENTTTRHHPLHLLLLVLLSSGRNSANSLSWDKLGASWGLAAPERMIDVAGIEAEMTRTPDLQINRLVLGWDGKSWTVRELIDRVLRPVGYYLRTVEGGKIGVGRLKPLSAADAQVIEQSRVIELSERLERRLDQTAQVIRATFGLPWGEQSTISFANRGKQGRLWWPESDKVGADFDLSAFGSPDNFGKSAASNWLEWVLQLCWRPIPTQRVRVQGSAAQRYWPGAQVALVLDTAPAANSDGSRGVFVGKAGDRIENQTLLGLVVEASYSAQDAEWDLALWLQNDPLRGEAVGIAPAARVVSYAAGVLTVERTLNGVDLADYLVSGSAAYWILCDKRFVPRAWAAPVTFVSVASRTLSPTQIELTFNEGPASTSPQPGEWLKLAQYDEQGAGDQAFYLYGADDTPALDTTDPPKWYV